MRCTGLVFLLLGILVSRTHGLVYETSDAIIVEVDDLTKSSIASEPRRSRQFLPFSSFNSPASEPQFDADIVDAQQQDPVPEEETSSQACSTKTIRNGRCVSYKTCYPHFRVPHLENLEGWALGAKDSCNYIQNDGRQIYGICCPTNETSPTRNNPFMNLFQQQQGLFPFQGGNPFFNLQQPQQQPQQYPFMGGNPFLNFQQPQLQQQQLQQSPQQQFPPMGFYPGFYPGFIPFPMYPGFPSQPGWPGAQQPQKPEAQQPSVETLPPPTTTTTTTTPAPEVQATTTPTVSSGVTTSSTEASTTTTTTNSPPVGSGEGINPANCGMAPNVDRIVGGVEAKPGEFPWIAALLNGGRQFCGGSLIDSTHILTAAHCIAHMSSWDVARLQVRLNEFNIKKDDGNEIVKRVRRVTRHKGFDAKTLYNDIAILTLDSPVNSVATRAVCLPSGNADYAGQEAVVAGWGSLRESGPQPETLQKVDVTVKTNDDCKRNYGNDAPGGIIDTFLCAAKPNKDSCSGDSGGPLTVGGCQVGIVSWGISCATKYYGVYTRVTSFKDWIERNRAAN